MGKVTLNFFFFGIYFQPTSQFYSYSSIRGPELPTTFTQLSNNESDVQECQRNTNRTKIYTFQWFRKPSLKFTVPLGMHVVYAFGARAFPPIINLLNPELNPICYLLALLAHHFLHVSRIRVKSLTIRLLVSYIYIWSTYS